MPTPQHNPEAQLLRFGIFEVDLAAGELRKNGIKIKLQEQPFQILAMLLEKPGAVVGREEIRQRLWSSDTFVDFDHSLNTAVNKIREALGDSASSPHYVETLARRGYRFTAPVERISAQQGAGTKIPAQPTRSEPAIHPHLDVPLPQRALTRGLFALIQLMYLIFYVEALLHLRGVERVTGKLAPGLAAAGILMIVMITAGVGIPLRCYLLSAVGFDYRRLGENFRRMFLFLLGFDTLWAMSPFLLVEKIGFGAAFAATAALLYVPFSERTLVRLAYPAAYPYPNHARTSENAS